MANTTLVTLVTSISSGKILPKKTMKCEFCGKKITEKTSKNVKKVAFLAKKTYHPECLIKKKNGNLPPNKLNLDSNKALKEWIKKRKKLNLK